MKTHLCQVLKLQHEAAQLAKDLLIEVASMAAECSRTEGVECMQSALGLTRATAESRYSRLSHLIKDPLVRENVKNGTAELTMRLTTKKKKTK